MSEDKAHENGTGKSREERDEQPGPSNGVADDTDAVTLNPISDLLRRANRRLGRRGKVIVSVLVLCGLIWWNSAWIAELPGVSTAIQWWKTEPLPSGTQDRFTVAIARLEGDTEGTQRVLIVDALQGFTGVKVLRFDRIISLTGGDPESTAVLGHAKARKYLSESGAHVLIWGRVLSSGGKKAFRLYWTTKSGEERRAKHLYLPDQFSLPEVFWDDLEDVLGLLVLSSGAAFRRKRGEFIADELEPFIQRISALLEVSDRTQGWDPVARAQVRYVLATAQMMFGFQNGKEQSLQEAIAHYEIVLGEFTREQFPNDWATTQNNLANALSRLGEREENIQRLEEAVAAYNSALEVHTRERVPRDWAITQNNLGNALCILGERALGTLRLEQAVAAFNAALQVRTRDRVPLNWAATLNNLGTALTTLGERESGTRRLEEAVAAFKAALQVRTRARVPLGWAMTQNNLGNALRTLGERESSTQRLEEAVAACKAGLQVHTRERVPLAWADSQNNLGTALLRLGERELGTKRLEQAVAAFHGALQVRTRERVPLDWAMTQNNLGTALLRLGERESGTRRLEQAVAAYHAALEVYTRKRVPLDWAMTQNNFGNAQRAVGERKGTVAEVCAGFGAHLGAWEEFSHGAPHYAEWAAKNIRGDIAVLHSNFPSSEVAACLKKHEDLLRKFSESNLAIDPESP